MACSALDLQRTDITPEIVGVRNFVTGRTQTVLSDSSSSNTGIPLSDVTVDAEVLASHVFVPPTPVPPNPDPLLPDTFDPVVAKKFGGTCVAVDANGEPDCGETGAPVLINIITVDPDSGEQVISQLTVADFLANNVPNAPPAATLRTVAGHSLTTMNRRRPT